jgi:hypothetical protein
MEYLILTSLCMACFYTWAYNSEFSMNLMRRIIASQELPIEKDYCIYAMPESKYIPTLWALIGCLALLLLVCWITPLIMCCKSCSKKEDKAEKKGPKNGGLAFLCVLSDTYKELIEGG